MMGYYVHNCPKMQYKAQFRPSVLLCPFSHRWVRFEDAVSQLEVDQRAVIGGQEALSHTRAKQAALLSSVDQIRTHKRFHLQSTGIIPVRGLTPESQQMVTDMLAPALVGFGDRDLFFDEFVFTA
jgi:Arginine-tRNA-protein transferase, C terminus